MGFEKIFEIFADVIRKNALARFFMESAIIWYIINYVLSQLKDYLQRVLEILPSSIALISLIISFALNSVYYMYVFSRKKKVTDNPPNGKDVK